MNKARIISIISGDYTLYDLDTKTYHLAKPKGVFRNNKTTLLVGDIVLYTKLDPISVINEVLPRTNCLKRPLVSNVDQAIIVTSVKEPDLNLNLLDRFIAILEYNEIKPIIIFNKMDLVNNDLMIEKVAQYYREIGYNVYKTSTIDSSFKEILIPLLKNKISVITGQSGVGKSSILNLLDETLLLKTQNISKALNRGKHTTRTTKLINLFDGWIADSPGFGIIDFSDMDIVSLSHSFTEFFNHSKNCKFSGCLHQNEPNCQIKKLVKEDKILNSRYENYLQIANEIKNYRKW